MSNGEQKPWMITLLLCLFAGTLGAHRFYVGKIGSGVGMLLTVGGCGIWNSDANWANATVVPTLNATIRNAVAQTGLTNVSLLDMSNALAGRRLLLSCTAARALHFRA